MANYKIKTMANFNHVKAQEYEMNYQRGYIAKHFKKQYDEWLVNKEFQKDGLIPSILSLMWEHNFFNGDLEAIQAFINHIKGKISLDIGCGCIPWTKDTWDVKKQYMMDPLAYKYKAIEIELFGDSFFEGTQIYANPAEEIKTELINTIDGFIFCRNAIDHSADPLSILNNISDYAMKGCYLLFWCDIWHVMGGDDGHHSITKSIPVMDKIFKGLGFKKIITMDKIRIGNELERFVEYGGVFIKE